MALATRGVVIEEHRQADPAHPNRADIACFVGFTGVRDPIAKGNLPSHLESQLREAGWIEGPHARPSARQLLDVPVTVDSWEEFDGLFAWDRRQVEDSHERMATPLGASVRAFFAEGGRRCIVVRAGDAWSYGQWFSAAVEGLFLERIAQLIPGYPSGLGALPQDRATWHGLGHLAGLPEASFLLLPDLEELCAAQPDSPPVQERQESQAERWVECSDTPPGVAPLRLYRYPAARSDRAGYARWSLALSMAIRYLARYRRDVEMVASLPRPLGSERIGNLFEFLTKETGVLAAGPDLKRDGIASAFLQVAYPWVKTRASADLPEGIEAPAGVLAGQLARNALMHGTFRSARRVAPQWVADLAPALGQHEVFGLQGAQCFRDRIATFGHTPGGIRLLSDVTTALGRAYRSAGVSRLVGVLIKAARQAGEESLFENSGPRLWEELESRLGSLMQQFYEAGALGGASPAEAYTVRCDQTTMTANDIDNGRLVAEVRFLAAFALEQITVRLVLGQGPVAVQEAA